MLFCQDGAETTILLRHKSSLLPCQWVLQAMRQSPTSLVDVCLGSMIPTHPKHLIMHPTSYWFDYVSDKFGEHLSESQVEPYLAQATFNGMSSFVEQLSGYGMRHLNRVSDLTLFDIVANYSRTVMGRPLAPEVAARLKYRFGSASDKPITNPAPVINKIKVSGDPRLGNTLSCNISMEKQEQERERERERFG